MAVFRKEKPSFLATNLKFLRKNSENTLEEMADFLSLKGKSSYNAYEAGRALPDIHKVMKLANYFDVSLEDLVYKDISTTKPIKDSNVTKSYQIELVPVKAAAGYIKGFRDTEWVNKLNKINIPYKPYGIARAFEIDGDSMEPEIKDRSRVIGIKIGRNELRDNHTYIIVLKDGLLCKNIRIGEDLNTVYLISKNERYPPKHINSGEVLELWEVWKKDI